MKISDTKLPDVNELEMLLKSYTESSKKPIGRLFNFNNEQSHDTEISAYDELMGLIGLQAVKKEIAKQISYARIMQLREESGKTCPARIYNILLSGNPGTGKTMCARLISRIFHEIGLLSKGHLVEVSRSSLVGRYIGETEANTIRALESAQGGALFIDELYTLCDTTTEDTKDFGMRAIDTLLPRITDLKDTIIIGAGYTDKIQRFMDANPGLASRFPLIIGCADYSVNELMDIGLQDLKKMDFDIEPAAMECLRQLIKEAVLMPNFGNARFIKTLLQDHIIPEFCRRVYEDILCGRLRIENAGDANTIMPQDIPSIKTLFPIQKQTKKIGYHLS